MSNIVSMLPSQDIDWKTVQDGKIVSDGGYIRILQDEVIYLSFFGAGHSSTSLSSGQDMSLAKLVCGTTQCIKGLYTDKT